MKRRIEEYLELRDRATNHRVEAEKKDINPTIRAGLVIAAGLYEMAAQMARMEE